MERIISKKDRLIHQFILSIVFFVMLGFPDFGKPFQQNPDLDKRVEVFLEKNRDRWYDMNVPASDGQVLHDIIVKNNYRSALEIGTSTGHSAIWIAWALSKTGGKLITIEINESRYRQALANFEEAGLSFYIDARLADAHQLVPRLKECFDFVFCDADKGWYKNYFMVVFPKLKTGGCYTAHNVSNRSGRRRGGIQEFLDHVRTLPNMKTTIVDSNYSGISVSYKLSDD